MPTVYTHVYMLAINNCFFTSQPYSVLRPQSAAVEASLKTVTEAMYEAADRGDLAAKKAIEELKRRPRRQ